MDCFKGHSDALFALGIKPPSEISRGEESKADDITSSSTVEKVFLVPTSEMSSALEEALRFAELSDEEIRNAGWKLVFENEKFSLYKRRAKGPKGKDNGPIEYLMTGRLPDVSARTFLHSQIDKQCRKQWDKTMKDMSDADASVMETGNDESEDILYYRTKWPWPLKDRDYTLARR
jgi:hypothetical protein